MKTNCNFKPNMKESTCNICKKVFKSEKNLKKHTTTVHEDNKHKCESCGNSFPDKYNLERHMKTHKEHKDYNNCQSCSKSFTRPDGLKRHMKTVHGDQKIISVNIVVNSLLVQMK